MKTLLIILLHVIVLATAQTYNYCDALHKSLLFYEAQRSGRLPSTNRVPWRGDSALGDCTATSCTKDSNGDGNLAGGYYDAGDGVKFAFPLAYALTTLSWGYIEAADAIDACGEKAYYLDAIRWGMDWMIKAHPSPNVFWAQVGNGGVDHSFWGPPEKMTMSRPAYKIDQNNPGSDMALSAAAAFASSAIVFKTVDPTYAATLLTHAKQLWTFGYTYRGFYSNSIPDADIYYKSWGYTDDLVWGSAWLARATGEATYLNTAKSDYDTYGIMNMAMGQSFDWDQKSAGVIVLMSQLTGDSKYTQHATQWLNSWAKGNGMTYTAGGLAWLRQWGPLRYTGGSAFIASIVKSSSSSNWAKSQIDYMLGSNPTKFSYLCGFGTNYPKNPHHRAAHGSTNNDINNPPNNKYVLNGALVGGPGSSDDYVDSRTDYIKNEVAIDYNAGFTAALVALLKTYPSTPSTQAPSTQAPSTQAPATQAPATKAPSTQAPATQAPTTRPPSTQAPATQAPTNRPPIAATQAPTNNPGNTANPLIVEPHTGGSAWWVAIDIKNSSKDVLKVELMDGVGVKVWTEMAKQTWGYWTYQPNGQPVSAPFYIRVTSVASTTITVLVQDFTGGSYNSGSNF